MSNQDEIGALTKSGNVSPAAVERMRSDPLGAELFRQGAAIQKQLDAQDRVMQLRFDQQDVVIKEIEKQAKLSNGRVKSLEEWQKICAEREKTQHDAEAIRDGIRRALALPFRYGWKFLGFIIAAVVAGGTLKDSLEFLLSILKHWLP